MEALPSEIKTRFNTKISHIDFASCHAYGVRRKEQTIAPGQENDDGRVGGGTRGEGRSKKREKSVEDEEGTAFDLVIGCDGSWSKVRSEMMRVVRFVFSRTEDSERLIGCVGLISPKISFHMRT